MLQLQNNRSEVQAKFFQSARLNLLLPNRLQAMKKLSEVQAHRETPF